MVIKLEAAATARAAVVAAGGLDAAALAAARETVQVHGRGARREQEAVGGLGAGGLVRSARDGGRERRVLRGQLSTTHVSAKCAVSMSHATPYATPSTTHHAVGLRL